jgi:asparagine synthase (glutamine-hydrolysing)
VRDILLQILNDPNAPVRPFINVPLIKDMVEDKTPGQTHAFNEIH